MSQRTEYDRDTIGYLRAVGVEGAMLARVEKLMEERDRLQRWKDEALPVMAGLQELGKALGLPPGQLITGQEAADAALALRRRAEGTP